MSGQYYVYSKFDGDTKYFLFNVNSKLKKVKTKHFIWTPFATKFRI